MTHERNDRRPILVNGEYYVEPIKKGSAPVKTKFPRTYDEAREILLGDLKTTQEEFLSLPVEKRVSDPVFCVRMHSKFIAKSYFPDTFFESSPVTALGSRRWKVGAAKEPSVRKKKRSVPEEVYSKLIFVKGRRESFGQITDLLNKPLAQTDGDWVEDVQKIDHISLLRPEEQLLGFDESWAGGWVEMVLHPLERLSEEAKEKLLRSLIAAGVESSRIHSAEYSKGLTFIAAKLAKKHLSILQGFNPLRTAHPLTKWDFPTLRDAGSIQAPKPAPQAGVSTIKVGVFDGGADPNLSLLQGHVTAVDLATAPAVPKGLLHGSAVAGAVLYGPLNDYGANAIVPPPNVSVVSFRVLPQKNPQDYEMYEVVDRIEETVPERQDIKVYNLSLGPEGPVLDDHITRFTYVLDNLSYLHKVLFVVAAGNDGALASPSDRVQAPSDLVNGIGVGAWSYKAHGSTDKVRAPYSCVGPGREGSKIKPDISAFGGCANFPFHLVSMKDGHLFGAQGTSFSAPLVTRQAAELLGRSDRLAPIMAKVLMVHSSQHPMGKPDFEFGHGCIPSVLEDLTHCDKNRVTVLFQGSLRSGKYAKLPIPFASDQSLTGTASVSWTMGLLVKPDLLNSDEYCSMGIEDTFYPNSKHYSFYKKGKAGRPISKRIDLRIGSKEAEKLVAAGWTQSKLPLPASGSLYKANEFDRRVNYKWDSVVHRRKGIFPKNLVDPFLILHAMGRNDHSPDDDPVHYAVAATIDCPRYPGDLYSDILRQYNQLQPIRVKATNEILVGVTGA